METGYLGRFDTSPVTGSEDQITVGLYMVKVSLVFDFATQGVGDKDGESVGLWIYECSFVIGDTCGLEAGEPIIHIFLAVSVNELRCNI